MNTQELYAALSTISSPCTARLETRSPIKLPKGAPEVYRDSLTVVRLAFELDHEFVDWAEETYGGGPYFREDGSKLFDGPVVCRGGGLPEEEYTKTDEKGKTKVLRSKNSTDFADLYIRIAPLSVEKESLTDGEYRKHIWESLKKYMLPSQPVPRVSQKPVWMCTKLSSIRSISFADGPFAGQTFLMDD